MKFLSVLALNVAVVAAGLFVYDRWLRGDPHGDPLADAAIERLEGQLLEIQRRRVASRGSPRRQRIAQYVGGMDLGVTAARREALVDVLEGFQTARDEYRQQVLSQRMDQQAMERGFRALLERHRAKLRALVKDPKVVEALVTRFMWDGRPLRLPPQSGAGAGSGATGSVPPK